MKVKSPFCLSQEQKKSQTYRVLFIDEDAQACAEYLRIIQELVHCQVKTMSRLPEHINWIHSFNDHLIIASEQSTGLNFIEQIKKVKPATSVIMVSEKATVESAVAAIRFGAEDYLTKPFGSEALQLAIKRGLNIEHYFRFQQLAYVDEATGLYNSRYLTSVLEREIFQSEISKKSFALLFIDADKFKLVNDRYGHVVGTKLLNQLGNHLKKQVRESDMVFRYGGDEFVAVLSPSDFGTAQSVAERIQDTVEKGFFLASEGLHIRFTVSIGIALFPDHAKTQREVIEVADRAMFRAKKSHWNPINRTARIGSC